MVMSMLDTDFKNQSYYEILDLHPGAAPHEIQAAYLRAKETYSPESPALYSIFSEQEAKELLRLIEEAYHTLSNQARREKYDQSLNLQSNKKASSNQDPPTNGRLSPVDGSAKPFKTESSTNNLPEGHGRTRISTYQIDLAVEEEIAETETFDGAFLQKVRKYKQVSIERMSEETRISKSYLSAVESDQFEKLPAPVFVRGFVVQIAKTLGLDDQKVANSYMNFYRQQKKIS